MGAGVGWVIPLAQAADCDERLIGGKAGKLAQLARAGFRVPAGFFITTRAYEHLIKGENLARLIRIELGRKPFRELRRFFCGLRPRFDLVLLGLGSDGHTASLFPTSEALEETERLAVATTAFHDNRPTERVTLTLPAINAAWQALFLVSGAEKAEIVQAVLADIEERLPARRIRPVAGHLAWFLDAAAASRVPNVLPYRLFALVRKRV